MGFVGDIGQQRRKGEIIRAIKSGEKSEMVALAPYHVDNY